MRRFALSAVLSGLISTAATAETDVSTMIATDGLAATENHLAGLAAPTGTELFALGGVRFLGGIETALQLRWRVGLTDGMWSMLGLPLLRLPIPENPAPLPFEAHMIEAMFAEAVADMEGALAALDQIEDGAEVGLRLALSDIWFDINANGARDAGEGMADVAGLMLTGGFAEPPAMPTVRFDTADAAWLSAYAHLLAGISETVLAIGPTDPIQRVMETAQGYLEVAGPPVPSTAFGIENYATELDVIAMVIFALEQQPDADRARAAKSHFLSMVADNRVFWTRVAQETDNDAEWIPNKTQVSALGLPVPPETGPRWLAVLNDAEKVLNGELLVPYWRLGPGAGLNIGAMFDDPPPLDPIGMIQGETFLPFAEVGPLANMRALRDFEALVGGDAPLFMVFLN